MATLWGKYRFDINLDRMSADQLNALKDACEHWVKQKHRDEIREALNEINLKAHVYGFDICVLNDYDFPQVMNEYTLAIKDHDEITKLYDES